MARGLVNDVSQCGSLGAPRSRYAGSRNSIPPPIQHTFAFRRHGKRGAPEFEFQRQWAAWGADKPSANLSPGSSPEDLDYSGSRSRESCGAPCPNVVPALPLLPLTQVAPGRGRRTGSGVGTPLQASPNIPDAHLRGRPPWPLILTPRKVPIVHLQSCFKVTLISKLLAALACDYSCINQGEIMPVTD